MRRNSADLDALSFRQRVMVDVSNISLATSFVGSAASMPLGIAPTGLAGLFHADGEILGARAAAACGIPFCLEHYVDLLDRGRQSGDAAAVLVPAVPDEGPRLQSGTHRSGRGRAVFGADADARPAGHRRAAPRSAQRPYHSAAPDAAKCPRCGVASPPGPGGCCSASAAPSAIWSGVSAAPAAYARWPNGPPRSSMRRPTGAMSSGCAAAGRENSSSKACSMPRMRRLGFAAGADAIVVSNHGGRQLDGAPSTISVLQEIVDAVGGALRGDVRRRHPLRTRHCQGIGAWRARRADRQVVSICAGGRGGGGRHARRSRSCAMNCA